MSSSHKGNSLKKTKKQTNKKENAVISREVDSNSCCLHEVFSLFLLPVGGAHVRDDSAKSKAETLKPLMSAFELKPTEGVPGWRLNQWRKGKEMKQRRATRRKGGLVSKPAVGCHLLLQRDVNVHAHSAADKAYLTSVHTRHAVVMK